jgi:hypothetical protein
MTSFISYANRPSRLSILSDDAIDRSGGSGLPNSFNYPLQENILNAKAVQLMAARIPNVFPPIPPYQRYFGYFIAGVPTFFMVQHDSPEPSLIYSNYAALATQLNIDAAYRVTWVGTPLRKADFLAAPLVGAELSFAMNVNTERIVATNLTLLPITLMTEFQISKYFAQGELVKNYLYLNFLLGFDTVNATIVPASLPPFVIGTLEAVSYINLARTSAIYIMSNISINGSMLSNGDRNLLQMIPVDVPFLNIINYQAATAQYTEAVTGTIGTISIYLLDDNLQPLIMPENAETLFELGFLYEDSVR